MAKAVIFDVDGTLVDTVDFHAKAWQEAFQAFGHDIPFDQIRQQIGKGGDQLMPLFLSKEELNRRGKEIEEYRGDLYKRKYFPRVSAFPSVRELFEHIRAAGQKIALASSCKGDELLRYKQIARIEDLVDAETTADDAEKSKPHPDVFEAVLERLSVDAPPDAIVVGDSPWDAEAAGKAGLRTIGMLSGGFPEQQLRDANCVAIFRDPADLLRNYDRSPGRARPNRQFTDYEAHRLMRIRPASFSATRFAHSQRRHRGPRIAIVATPPDFISASPSDETRCRVGQLGFRGGLRWLIAYR